MKRKFKLFATVASLCLSVALMAFGVYAAAQVTYTVNGSVSYTVKNALVEVNVSYTYAVKTGEESTGLADGFATYSTGDPTMPGGYSYKTTEETLTKWTSYDETSLLQKPEGQLAGTGTIAVNFNTSTLWKITINVKTLNESGVKVTLDTSDFGVAEDANYFVVGASTNDYATAVEKTDADGVDFVYYVFLKSPAVGVSEDPTGYTIPLDIAMDQP